MQTEISCFYSDGLRLEGAFYRPDAGSAGHDRPRVLACSGFTGLRAIHPERFARALTARGYSCFGFDYRGQAASEGPPNRILCQEQVRDIRHAATHATRPGTPQQRPLVLLGWGMGAGLVLEAARGLPNLRGLICLNGLYRPQWVQRQLRGGEGWRQFEEWIAARRLRAVASARPIHVDPFEIYPLDPASRDYVNSVLRKQPGYGGDVDFALADSLLDFRPLADLSHLERVPLLVGHGDRNALHPPAEAQELVARYPGPKALHWIAGCGHTEWMHDDNPSFLSLVERLVAWLGALG